MVKAVKTTQLQIRVSASQKLAIQRAAVRSGLDMSAYVLSRVLSVPATQFKEAVTACAGPDSRFGLAELNTLLCAVSAGELREAVNALPTVQLTPFVANYIAAMVEYACAGRALKAPDWTRAIEPLPEPAFGSTLASLRLHLLTRSPPPFRRRNLFIDATLGQQV
jgi:hypothetical protein